MPYESEGTYTSEKREVAVSETWDSWANPQASENVEVVGGSLQLAEAPDIPASVIHQWRLDESSGTTATDSVGSADGTINGHAWVSGDYEGGHALDSDGTNDHISVDLSSLVADQYPNFSIAATMEVQNNPSVMGADDSVDSQTFLFGDWGFHGSSGFTLGIRDENANADVISVGSLTTGQKIRVVGVVDGTSPSGWRIHENTTELSKSVDNNDGVNESGLNNIANMYLSAFNSAGMASSLDGIIDNITIYDESLTASQVTGDYNAQPWS